MRSRRSWMLGRPSTRWTSRRILRALQSKTSCASRRIFRGMHSALAYAVSQRAVSLVCAVDKVEHDDVLHGKVGSTAFLA